MKKIANKVANFLRFFFGIFFLVAAAFNTYLTITNPDGYKNGGTTAWPPFLQHFWVNVVATHMVLFLVLFILIEVALGLLLLNKGKWVKIGLAGSILFSAGLLFIGLGYSQDYWPACIPNMAVALIWALLLFSRYDKTLLETIRHKKDLTQTAVIGS
jgi:hypothetical protein